ncbi:MAG: prepilin-type N-terminal cleavage/methylation domain-containing protein [Deltaproteobacteria bacterium]
MRYTPNLAKGFTLLELLISITLIAVLILVLSLGVRTGIRAWIRGKETSERVITSSAMEGLLSRQLQAAIRQDSHGAGEFTFFQGEPDELLFVTAHAPLSSLGGGIHLVHYWYDAEAETLFYSQKLLTRKEDLDAFTGGSTSIEDEEDWESSKVPGVTSCVFAFTGTGNEKGELLPPGTWEQTWKPGGDIPKAVAMSWSLVDEPKRSDKDTDIAWSVFPTDPLSLDARP